MGRITPTPHVLGLRFLNLLLFEKLSWTLQVGYDDGFKTKVGGTSQAEAYIAATWPHIQVSYCHSSLGSKVLVERLPGIKHYAGKTLVASGAKLSEMFDLTVSDIGSADLMLYMGYDTAYYGTVGIAWSPVVCDPSPYNKYKVNTE